jgi:S1-C subfamily serine protease
VVQGTVDGGAAKAAGIKDNDRIIRINDSPVKDIYGYMAAMKDLKPGEEVAVTVVRDSKEQTIKVKLQLPRRETGRE